MQFWEKIHLLHFYHILTVLNKTSDKTLLQNATHNIAVFSYLDLSDLSSKYIIQKLNRECVSITTDAHLD